VTESAIRRPGFGIRDAGDAALLLELDAVIDPAVNARAIAIAAAVVGKRIAGVRDVIPTYRSVAVHFDPLMTDVGALAGALGDAANSAPLPCAGPLVEVPVAYGGDDGPDLSDVAAFAGLSEQDVIARHSSVEYRVFMLGFLPGFAYMGSVDDAIAAPRRATPRIRVPGGSVGLAGRQTGIYPRQSPGGWQLIGRTSMAVFDPHREPASIFAPGDRVRFVATRGTPAGIRDRGSDARNANANPIPDPRSSPFDPGSRVPGPGSRVPDPGSRVSPDRVRSITVVRPGLSTTVQDGGRWGHQDRGVPVAGPMDAVAHRVANALVGNPRDAATLEATVLGPELRFDDSAVVAIGGADLDASIDGTPLPVNMPRSCAAGAVLRCSGRRVGARAYIACDGGIAAPLVLGSRATHVVSCLGGFNGSAVAAGDRLPLGAARTHTVRAWFPSADLMKRGPIGSPEQRGARVRVMRGPQDDCFDDEAFEILHRTRFSVSSQSDRIGYRLTGAPIRSSRGSHSALNAPGHAGGNMISDATFMGGLQVTPSGGAILLMADRQTTGGYPQIATVITADLPVAGQLAPGDWIEFELCTRAEAMAALIAQERRLLVLG
jgi:KipI family sensor histidine kinase inhibitor